MEDRRSDSNYNVRKYGSRPYRLAVIHGGPGAVGSLGYMAKLLCACGGVLEPLQTKYSIDELLEELHCQLTESGTLPIVLMGHSWGAWLSMLYAARFSQNVKSLILVGTPPLEDKYVPTIMDRRMANLSETESFRLRCLFSSDNPSLKEMEHLVYKSDNYCPLPKNQINQNECHADGKMNRMVWSEAAQLRTAGDMLRIACRIACPIVLIHGREDPHPIDGVTEPLRSNKVPFVEHIFPRCGHSPFYEKEWSSEFCRLVWTCIDCEK